jgi:hypothetical protein
VSKSSKVVSAKKKVGRPSSFSQSTADELCAYLSSGQSLRTACNNPNMPTVKTVFNWFRTYPEFLQQYARAKQEAADAMAEEILDISDDGTNDWMEINRGNYESWQVNGEAVQRSKLRVDTRKWLMAKMKPKVYGDKLDLTTDGKEMPAPIIAINALPDTTKENKREIIDAEVPENTALNQPTPNTNIMNDINENMA